MLSRRQFLTAAGGSAFGLILPAKGKPVKPGKPSPSTTTTTTTTTTTAKTAVYTSTYRSVY